MRHYTCAYIRRASPVALALECHMNARRRFDWIIDRQLPRSSEIWDTEIADSPNFSVVPSLGSLVPGWLLIVPRRPTLNLAALSNDEKAELRVLASQLRSRLANLSGEIFEFEHGGQYHGSAMGCGLDQAHLHVVPLPFDLVRVAKETSIGSVVWMSSENCADPWARIPAGQEYLLARSAAGSTLIGLLQSPVSQWFRRLIAQQLYCSENWDYRIASGIDNIKATLRAVHSDCL
jgi:diadenosine tetraphosphate (Ap4A) HIT family hydrolase